MITQGEVNGKFYFIGKIPGPKVLCGIMKQSLPVVSPGGLLTKIDITWMFSLPRPFDRPQDRAHACGLLPMIHSGPMRAMKILRATRGRPAEVRIKVEEGAEEALGPGE